MSLDVFEADVQRHLARLSGAVPTPIIPSEERREAKPIKLGAAYNVFDGEELLLASIRSIRPLVQYVCVVYQTGEAIAFA